MKKTKQLEDFHQTPNDLDRHLCWLFVACKLGKTDEATNEFLLYLKQACERTCDQLEEEYKAGIHGRIINAIPYISGHLADLVNLNKGN